MYLKNNKLFKTNLYISIILVIGFTLTAFFSYKANYQASLDSIEQISSLTAGGIYYQLTTSFTKPVNVSLTMAHDSLLESHLLLEKDHLEDADYIETTKNYLSSYHEKYNFDSIFLVSSASRRYYNFNGLDRVLEKDNPENTWYFDLMNSSLDYSLNVDNDEVEGADNEITVFVNCKVYDSDGSVLGVVGIGIRVEHLTELLQGYENQFQIKTSLIDENGIIQISTDHSGYEQIDWFTEYELESLRKQVLTWEHSTDNLELWCDSHIPTTERRYIVTRYIPELSWHLVVSQDTGALIREMQRQMYQTCAILILVILCVVLIVTTVIRNFNKQVTTLVEERQALFKKSTEQLYDSIYELNVTKNCAVGKRTQEYFDSFGAKGLSYEQGLHIIAQKQIKEEFQEGYINTFSPANVLRSYEAGTTHLSYDFLMSEDGSRYYWMRIDAHIFHSPEDASLHMFVYRKNIDEAKRRELQALTDEMTGLYTKKASEHKIENVLARRPAGRYAFFIFDIDNFKQVNDRFGHAFGDYCIQTFASIIRQHFSENAILGRIGGDEFAAFVPVDDSSWIETQAQLLTKAFCTVCEDGSCSWQMSASIGIALYPEQGTDFTTIYQNADAALYHTKKQGKSGYTIYNTRISISNPSS